MDAVAHGEEEEEEVHPDEGREGGRGGEGVSRQTWGSLVASHLMHLLRLRV